MENIVLVVHLILALCLIGVVLLQRSEGGGLGMGGGGAISSRGVATALTKMTWIFAICFIATSIALTVFAAQRSAGTSVIDRLGLEPPASTTPDRPAGSDLLPPPVTGDPLTPPRAD
jgi:preprotein translocase subunit SecG